MSENSNDQIKNFYETYVRENERFSVNKVKSAAPKARKALQLLGKAIKERRKEIMDEKKAMDAEKVS